jgi:malate dehydrogenase (oxaloacetate-decarboxylating)(NADP+)
MEIFKNKEKAYEYTNKGNIVAVISNGTAVLGLGNLGPLGSKPVMEGKAALFNKFAGIESVDLCLDAPDPESLIQCIKCLGPSFGGINLEDIKSPDCFIVEDKLKEIMDIPVFHDDQHGTAIVCLAGLINAMHIADKKVEDIKVVLNGAGAAGIACLKLMVNYGVKLENVYALDTRGVIYKGRKEGMNQWKE